MTRMSGRSSTSVIRQAASVPIAAWDVTTGSPNVVVAVVDTGYRPHADLAGRILPGYDFVSDPKIANDGNGRDADATDPGDWVDAGRPVEPDISGSGLRRSRTARGTARAWRNHRREFGQRAMARRNRLGGEDSAGARARQMRRRRFGHHRRRRLGGWPHVPGVPANPYPAQVINISLGGPGDCTPLYHSVLSAALSHGVTRAIVVAAGNETTDVSTSAPANCSEVIAVAATTKFGSLACYSNFGAGVALSAPGGDAPIETDGIAVLFNTGTTVPDVDTWAKGGGHELLRRRWSSGVASLVLGIAPKLDATPSARAARRRPRRRSAGGSDCDTTRCGAGIVNASCGRRRGARRRARAQLPGTVVECAGGLRVGLGHQLRAPGRHDLRELVHLRRQRPRLVARDDCARKPATSTSERSTRRTARRSTRCRSTRTR